MKVFRFFLAPLLLFSLKAFCFPVETETDLVKEFGASFIDASEVPWQGYRDSNQALAIKSTVELADSETQVFIELKSQFEVLAGSVRKVVSRSGESVLLDTSVLSGSFVTEVKTEIIDHSTDPKKQITISFQESNGSTIDLIVTASNEKPPFIILTEDQNILASHWDNDPVNLMEIMPLRSARSVSTTSQPDDREKSPIGLYVLAYSVSIIVGEIAWVFSALNYSIHDKDKNKFAVAYGFRVASLALAFPFTLLQEVVGQALFYCMETKFGGLELLHLLTEGSAYPDFSNDN